MAAFRAAGLLAVFSVALASELTFDMSPHEEHCFYEDITQGTEVTVEFQVSHLDNHSKLCL
jgi:hypothetical protein